MTRNLLQVIRGGKRLPAGCVTLEEARRHALSEQRRLPDSLRQLKRASVPYPIDVSAALNRDLKSLRHTLEASQLGQATSS